MKKIPFHLTIISPACTVVNPAWLAVLGKDTLCTFSKPSKNSRGELMVIPRFGLENWELPPIKAEKVIS